MVERHIGLSDDVQGKEIDNKQTLIALLEDIRIADAVYENSIEK